MSFCFFAKSYSQLKNSVSLSGGIVQEESYGFLLNYNYNTNNSNYEIGIVHSIFKKRENESFETEFSNTSLQLGYLHSVLRNRNNSLFINLGIGVFGGYENVKEYDNLVLISKSGPIGGVYGVGELDFYISDKFAFILRGQQNYLLKSSTGKMNPYFGFGVKFNF